MNEFKKRIIHFVLLTKFEKLILIVVKVEEFISSKYKKIFPKITIIVFSVIMFHQIIQVINVYYSYEIVTRFEVQKIKVLPHIRFSIYPKLKNLDKLFGIYPEMTRHILYFSGKNESLINFDNENLRPIYEFYLEKLLLDRKLDEFHQIVEKNKVIGNCYLLFEKETKIFPKGDFGIIFYNPTLQLTYLMNVTEIENWDKLETILLKLNNFNYIDNSVHTRMYLLIYHSNEILETQFNIEMNTKTIVSFTSFSVKELNTYGKNVFQKKMR
jgi:hypothetical protein